MKCFCCGSRYWEAVDGKKIPFERVIETELRYLRGLAKENKCQ